MSAVELVGVKNWFLHLKALEMRMRKLLLDLYLAQILPEKSKKMILLKKLGFIDVLSAVRVSHILGIRLIKYISFLRMYISSRLFFCDKCKFQTSEYGINDTIRIKIKNFNWYCIDLHPLSPLILFQALTIELMIRRQLN